jgi:hypothetical protein
MKFKKGDYVVVKGVGAAKVDEVLDGTYFMFFFNGTQGQGWKDHDIKKTLKPYQFWSEWKRCRAFN